MANSLTLTVVHDGRSYVNFDIEALTAASIPQATIIAAVGAKLTREGEAEIDRLGDLLSVSSSRAARYTDKLAEAKAFIAANRPANPAAGTYPILTAEATARSLTRSVLADMVMARGAGFTQLMALAEGQRFKLGIAVAAATTIEAKQAAVETEVGVFRTAVMAALAA
jgi:hypothetical protein